jgi:hypothetical protein
MTLDFSITGGGGSYNRGLFFFISTEKSGLSGVTVKAWPGNSSLKEC